MANIREIQGRIKSVRDTMKITNAMYMISSTKLQKARKSLESTEEYFFALQDMIMKIKDHSPDIHSRFFDERPEKKKEDKVRGIIVVTADKGLAGAYNHNILKRIQELTREHENARLYVVGEMGRHYFAGKNTEVAEHFEYSAQNPSLHRARVISSRLTENFLSGVLDEVYIVFTEIKSAYVCEPKIMKLLPFSLDEPAFLESDKGEKNGPEADHLIFKPDPEHVLDNIIPDCIMGYVYGALVESFCSEQNSRMLAMETANNNAKEMISELSVEFNRARQAMITQEITEVIAGARAQKRGKKTAGCGKKR